MTQYNQSLINQEIMEAVAKYLTPALRRQLKQDKGFLGCTFYGNGGLLLSIQPSYDNSNFPISSELSAMPFVYQASNSPSELWVRTPGNNFDWPFDLLYRKISIGDLILLIFDVNEYKL